MEHSPKPPREPQALVFPERKGDKLREPKALFADHPVVAKPQPKSTSSSSATPAFPPGATSVQAAGSAAAPAVRVPKPLFREGGLPDPLHDAIQAQANSMDAASLRLALDTAQALLSLPLTNPKPFMDFGKDAQQRMAALPDRLLAVVGERQDEVLLRLRKIQAQVRQFGVEDLLPSGTGIGAMLRHRLLPPEERLKVAIALVTVEMDGIAHDLPLLEARFDSCIALLTEEEAARTSLQAYVVAGEATLSHIRQANGIASDDASSPAGYCLRCLEDSLMILRTSRMANAGDAGQFSLLRESYKQQIAAVRGSIPELVALWKRQCAAALVQMRGRDIARTGQVAAEMVQTRDKLVQAIQSVVTPA